MEILALLRTRPGTCEFQWVKGHAENQGNIEADAQAEIGRLSDDDFLLAGSTPMNNRALLDGAKLSALQMKDIYSILIEKHTKEKGQIKHPELIEDAQNMILRTTGLKPSMAAIIKGTWKMNVPARLRDHLWNMTLGRIKCGAYWNHIPGFEERGFCSFCAKNGDYQTLETEQHIWLDCPFNGQTEAWEEAKSLWERTSAWPWPQLNIGTLRGIGALTTTDEQGKPSKDMSTERIRSIISITIWAIWKTRNNHAIQEKHTQTTDAKNLFIEILKENITKCWNALKFENERARSKKSIRLRKIWADGTIVNLEMGKAPTFGF